MSSQNCLHTLSFSFLTVVQSVCNGLPTYDVRLKTQVYWRDKMSQQLHGVDGVDLDEGQSRLRLRQNLLDHAEEVKDTDEVEFYFTKLSCFDRHSANGVQEDESGDEPDELSGRHPRGSRRFMYAVIAVMLILLLVLVCARAVLHIWCCALVIDYGGYSGNLYGENEEPVRVSVTFLGLEILSGENQSECLR
ncbi:uncharacterized protein LOC113203359 [Frankliniella occidentalis]|uniref:Uncharacterized protein LOC113203359 n=1 Tax=Frankliniella occidentalis TaxID=133901 RepID=A0A6J1S3M6_FRAOC|nr:uncharacterized protein LOC113203359 [Frankliniella occidentalis]